MPSPNITDWIGSVGTVLIGVTGIAVSITVAVQGGFRPRATAMVEQDGHAMAVRIVNRGRMAGMVERVDVVGVHDFRQDEFTPIPSQITGLSSSRIPIPFTLSAASLAYLVLIPDGAPRFPDGIGIRVAFGGTVVCVVPDPLPRHVRLERKTLLPRPSR